MTEKERGNEMVLMDAFTFLLLRLDYHLLNCPTFPLSCNPRQPSSISIVLQYYLSISMAGFE